MRRVVAKLGVLALLAAGSQAYAGVTTPVRASGAPVAPLAGLELAQFRALLIARLKALDPAVDIDEPDSRTLHVKSGGKEETLAIENAWVAYRSNPNNSAVILDRWARLALGRLDQPPVDAARLVSVVRPAAILDQLSTLVARPLAGDVVEALAFDSDEALRFATRSDLATLKLDEATAFKRGRANLKERIGSVNMGKLAGEEDGLEVISAESGLATGLLVSGATCGPDAPTGLGEGMHVLVLDRNSYLWANDGDPYGMGAFRRFVGRHAAAKDLLSNTPLRCVAGRWQAEQ